MSQPMASGGVYDQNSECQIRAALSASDVIERVASDIAPRNGSVVLVDYGCAQGRVTNVLLHDVVGQIRKSYLDVPIYVVHNDLLTNDWAALFERLRDRASYVHIPGGPITPLTSATSFYNPVTPRGVVGLGTSFAAAQWLSSPGPTGSGTALYFDQLDGDLKEAMAVQACDDWTRFLELRSVELAGGARLVVDLMCVPDGASAAGHDAWGITRAVCEELVSEGLLDAGHLDQYVIPVYERSRAEIHKPFESAMATTLALESLQVRAVPNPAAAQFAEDGNAAAFARSVTGFFRAFSEPSLVEGLSSNGRTMDELYRRVEARIQDTARSFSFDVHAALAVIRRRDHRTA